MVKGETVKGDLDSISQCFTEYTSNVDSLEGSWQGESYDSFKTSTSEFATTYIKTIKTGMEAFATACDKYIEYEEAKAALSTAESNKSSAEQSNDTDSASAYQSQIDALETKMATLKEDITTNLSTASSQKLEATDLASINASTDVQSTTSGETGATGTGGAGATGTDGTGATTAGTGAGSLAGKDWTGSDFKYFNQADGWNNYKYSNGKSSTPMQKSGCAPCAVAMVLASYGFNVNPNTAADWSAKNGYHQGIGTVEEFVVKYPESMGVTVTKTGYSKEKINQALSNNQLVLLHVDGKYTKSTGHYMIARAYDPKTDKYLIGNPGKRAMKWEKASDIMANLKQSGSFAYSLP